MGRASLGAFAARLLAVGRDPATPAACMQSATTAQQTVWRSASGFGTRALGNVWEEFWPDVKRKLFH